MWFRRDAVLVGSVLLAAGVFVFALVQTLGSDEAVEPATDGREVVALNDADDLPGLIGQRVHADDVEVESVPADEGFWMDAGAGRVWVQLETAGESAVTIVAGDRVSFTGEVVAHGRDFADRPEFPQDDAEALADAGAHVEVAVADLRLVPSRS